MGKPLSNFVCGLLLALVAFGYSTGATCGFETAALVFFILFMRFMVIHADCDVTLQLYELFGKPIGQLKGKVIWITGASMGIGESLAYVLAKVDAKLVLSARSEDKLDQVKKKCIEIGKLDPNNVLVVPFDMTNYEKHNEAFSEVMKHFGKLDILISNAGRGQLAEWAHIDTAVDRALFELNTLSLISLARIVTRHFLKVGKGHHVIMSSVSGKYASPFLSSYAASKFALMGYFESFRAELGTKGIDVTVICPGAVVSNVEAGALGETMDKKLKGSRLMKMLPTERCAHLTAVAMANRVYEAWIALNPFLLFVYLAQYCPTVSKWLMSVIDLGAYAKKKFFHEE